MLGSFESTFCGGCLMGFLGRGVGGAGERWQQTAGMPYVRGPMSVLSTASDGEEEGGGSSVRQL